MLSARCSDCKHYVTASEDGLIPGACSLPYAPVFKGKCTKFDKREEPGPDLDGQVFLFHEEEIK